MCQAYKDLMEAMMKLGLFNLMGLYDRNTSPISVVNTAIDAVKMAEDFGFDVAWFAEHHFTNHTICPSSLMMLVRCISETRQIRLGTAVLALPFYNPLRLVHELAFADLLATGRLVLGLGSGYQPQEFERFDVNIEDKNRITMEVWDVIEQGLLTGQIEYYGEHVRIPRTELPMRPFGLSLPEIFVASSAPELIGRAARQNCTPFMSFGHQGLSTAIKLRQLLSEHWRVGGGDPDTMPLAVQRYIYVTDDDLEAEYAAQCVRDLTRATDSLSSRMPSQDGIFLRLMPLDDEPPLADFINNAIIGSANHCAEKLHEEIETLKPSHLCCFMAFAGIGREQTLASIERFGYDVIPQLGSLVSMQQAA